MSDHTRDGEQTQDQVQTDDVDLSPDAGESEAAPATADTVKDAANNKRDDAADSDDEEQEQRVSAEEFAAEHDPEKHDVTAGEEFRQRGDWTADDGGGAQVWDSEGLVEGSGPGTAGSDESPAAESPAAESPAAESPGADTDASPVGGESDSGRRKSELDEVRDGGYGVGSAAPLDDGAFPLGHPVKAFEDTKTFLDSDHPRYADAEPHVWFTDADAAERAGFAPAGD